MSPDTARAIDLLFDAAINVGDWATALDALAASLGAAGAVVMPQDPDSVELGVPTSNELVDVFSLFIAQGWHRNDLRGKAAWPLFAEGRTVMLEHDLSTEEQRLRDPYYQEFFVPIGLPWFACAGFTVEGRPWSLSLLRGAGQGAFERDDIPRLEATRPHVARAVKLASKVRGAIDRTAAGVLDLVRDHGLAVDAAGKVVWTSANVAGFIGPELTIKGLRLQALDGALNRRLQERLRLALTAPNPSDHPAGSSVLVRREQGDHFLVEIVALPRKARDVFSQAAVMIFFRPLQLRGVVDPNLLVRLFGLTPGEAKVAALVASGITAVQAAQRLGIGYETVRTHLARAFAKIGVSRQSELAHIVARLE